MISSIANAAFPKFNDTNDTNAVHAMNKRKSLVYARAQHGRQRQEADDDDDIEASADQNEVKAREALELYGKYEGSGLKLKRVVVDKITKFSEYDDYSTDYAPVLLRVYDGSDRVIPLWSGNFENKILKVFFAEMRGERSSYDDEAAYLYEWENRIRDKNRLKNAIAVIIDCRAKDTEDRLKRFLVLRKDGGGQERHDMVMAAVLDYFVSGNIIELSSALSIGLPKEENNNTTNGSESAMKLSVQILDKDGKVNSLEWQNIKKNLRKELMPNNQTSYDLNNDSEVILALLVARLKKLPVYATEKSIDSMSLPFDWGLTYTRGHSCPKLVKRGTVQHFGSSCANNVNDYNSYDKPSKLRATKSNKPIRYGRIYRREFDRCAEKRLQIQLLVARQHLVKNKQNPAEAAKSIEKLQELQEELNAMLSEKARRAGAAKKIVDLEQAVRSEDYEAAAKLREELRELNIITWRYFRGRSNPM